LILAGVAIGAIGLVAAVAGMVAGQIGDAVSSFDPVAEATMPSAARFEAEPRRYDVSVTVRRGIAETRAAETACAIELADGTTTSLAGSRQAVATSSGGIASVGWFDAVAGPTTVRCSGADDGTRYVIDEYGTTDRVTLWVTLAGVAVLLVGVTLLVAGALWVKPSKRAPLTPR
jgi:hypothetical protein